MLYLERNRLAGNLAVWGDDLRVRINSEIVLLMRALKKPAKVIGDNRINQT